MSKRGTNPNSLKALNEHRNRSGQRNRAAVQFSRSLRELIVKEGESSISDKDGKRYKKIELVVRQLYNKAISGEGWAVTFIAERTEGKITDKIQIDDSQYREYQNAIQQFIETNKSTKEDTSNETTDRQS